MLVVGRHEKEEEDGERKVVVVDFLHYHQPDLVQFVVTEVPLHLTQRERRAA